MHFIKLRFGDSSATICPDMGGNCISLIIDGCDILRTPESPEVLRKAANVYGVPFLFPPNRINGGAYTFDGRTYRFPINEPARGHHIHGILSETRFDVVEETPSSVTLRYQATADKPYLDFPHAFTVLSRWDLSQKGLHHTLTVRNDGEGRMPTGVGFHTAFNAYFVPGDHDPTHYRLKMSAVEEITYHPETIIPTGERLHNTPLLYQLNGEGLQLQGEAVSRHMVRGDGGAQLIHLPSGRTVQYDVSDGLRYWMLWNAGGDKGFICPEPQSWIVDAPNQSHKTEESGFRALDCGESFTVETNISLH